MFDFMARSDSNSKPMCLGGMFLFLVFVLSLMPITLSAETNVQKSKTAIIDAELKIIDGKMVVALELVSRSHSQFLSFFIEPDKDHALSVHPQVIQFMGLQRGESEVNLVAVNGGRAPISVNDVGVFPDDDALRRASELFSAELADVILAGSLGRKFLDNYLLEININEGSIKLYSPESIGKDTEFLGDTIFVGNKDKNGVLSFPYKNNNQTGMFKLAGDYSTTIAVNGSVNVPESVYLEEAKKYGEKIVNVVDYAAIRKAHISIDNFESEKSGFADEVKAERSLQMLKLGVSFIKNFRVVIDYKNYRLGLTKVISPESSKILEDQKFYRAEAAKSPGQIVEFLEKHSDNQHAEEASQMLLEWRISNQAGEAEMVEAAKWVRDTAPEKGRGKYMMDLVERMRNERADDYRLALAIGEMGLSVVRQDGDPGNLYRLHNLLGETRLQNDDVQGAWRHFLSAAFGMSRNPEINLNLGLVYEKKGRIRRAYSRYRRALDLHTYNLENRIVDSVMNEKDVAAAYFGLIRLETELGEDDPLLNDL
ncbi:hypothetical protein QSV34_12450 [Porticoccus sp. W117]|uniref:tetratricopeptide repeat protein n=1 Tax=Porticoccus sp. W117 TaxID=3054777 RepID=UPI0025942F50|nr:hypothetical protein [Porticoccus sp. W117]MDM3872156.1 hypothetical protein [Porticoccus sp. W117]